jgi:putative transposase
MQTIARDSGLRVPAPPFRAAGSGGAAIIPTREKWSEKGKAILCYDSICVFKGENMPKSSLFYHFIWSTKHRQPLLDDSNKKIIYKSCIAKAVELGSIVLEIRAVDDHIHLLLSASPSIAPSVLVGQIKGVSSHLIRKLGWKDFSWQGEYGAYSVSESQLPIVIAYIQNQEKHHMKTGG